MKLSVKQLSRAAVIAALYVALCFFLKPISFGVIQFRVSEALCILPIFMPEAICGLFIGCFLSNFLGGTSVVLLDAILGSLTTLIAAYLTRRMYKSTKNFYLALLPPVILNALIVGTYLPFIYMQDTISVPIVLWSIFSVFLGEAVVIFLLGYPLAKALSKAKFFNC